MSAPSLLRPGQAAALMGVSARTIWTYIAKGVIPEAAVVRVGHSRQARLKRSVLEARGFLVVQP